jgi:hypothetical protein
MQDKKQQQLMQFSKQGLQRLNPYRQKQKELTQQIKQYLTQHL